MIIMINDNENRLHRYDINRTRTRHGHKYKMCFSIIMVICIKQQLSNMWSSSHEEFKQHWGWIEKKDYLSKKKRVCLSMYVYCVI